MNFIIVSLLIAIIPVVPRSLSTSLQKSPEYRNREDHRRTLMLNYRARHSRASQLESQNQEPLVVESHRQPNNVAHPRHLASGNSQQASEEIVALSELDNEDRSLLDKFYSEIRSQDPFQSERLSSQRLWDEMRDRDLSNLMDTLKDEAKLSTGDDKNRTAAVVINDSRIKQLESNETAPDGWVVDKDLVEQSQKLLPCDDRASSHIANYSPSMRLLTSYNPLKLLTTNGGLVGEESQQQPLQVVTDSGVGEDSGRIVGATLLAEGSDVHHRVSSTSPIDAIKMHNELLETPPRDGKVRVRMYFHRAIHDDVRLYGNGPWKYWGHGWGIEYGYDPKGPSSDFYQKGYTMERAYGRDFCKDPKNCRPADPHFTKANYPRLQTLDSPKVWNGS